MKIDLAPSLAPSLDVTRGREMWAQSGAMALTGRRGGPALPGPVTVAPNLAAWADRLAQLTARVGVPVVVDGPALLGERAAIAGHTRQGTVSCGGSCRLLPARDGWIALSLARPDDRAALAAWLGVDADPGEGSALDEAVARRGVEELVERAGWLGLPVSALGERRDGGALHAHELGSAPECRDLRGVKVVDLSSLWAGPLCSQLLTAAGADVVKVESATRPDGARRGPAAFFDLMHAGKASVVLDLASAAGRRDLARLVERADVVIEASRPRALEQLGIDAWAGSPRVWLSITGHGREQPMRVGFGDDAAVAAGLVASDGDGPVFAGDAAADPIAGLLAAVAVVDRLVAGGRWLVDCSLAGAAALAARAGAGAPTAASPLAPAPPRARPVVGRARPFGADTDRVLAALA